MKRRGFLKAVAAVPAFAAMPSLATSPAMVPLYCGFTVVKGVLVVWNARGEIWAKWPHEDFWTKVQDYY